MILVHKKGQAWLRQEDGEEGGEDGEGGEGEVMG